ncbi:hypothetical protein [Nocardiopsis tropica]|uniref:Uncharacterized protein n=1 Tax=Nocardiopsis tropica TaxID=109330 RepID=A0ABU7KI71_9ACTN|nr:hypothetical protein [Nocardiopsis umidischolae]MEE2048994.1 hypothetical protein [Nocardiopsis umidischolae]
MHSTPEPIADRNEPVDGDSAAGSRRAWCGRNTAFDRLIEGKVLRPDRGGSLGSHQVTDGPGAGTTVVAGRRAKHTLARLRSGERVESTTFSRVLAPAPGIRQRVDEKARLTRLIVGVQTSPFLTEAGSA